MATRRDTGSRTRTRILCSYDLDGQVPGASRGRPLAELVRFGRFNAHVQANQSVLPRVLLAERLDPGDFMLTSGPDGDLRVARCRVAVLATPYESASLILDLLVEDEPDAGTIARALAVTCFERQHISVNGEPLLAWLSDLLGAEVGFGRNVHQIVYPGGRLLADVLAAGPGDAETVPHVIREIIYRGTLSDSSNSRLAVRTPAGLNSPGSTLVAHGRGVSLIAGWQEHVGNCFALIAVVLQSALSVLQRTRHLAFETLDVDRQASVGTPSQARELISTLSHSLNEYQLGLVFGVEAYTDSLLIPEIVIEGYQTSLRESMGIDVALANSSRMMQRLTSVIDARAAALDAVVAERRERRERSFSAFIAIATLIALPPALLLAFFGINSTDVDPDRSMFDLARYWSAYLIAWLPFVALVAVGYGVRHRSDGRPAVRARIPRPRKGSTHGIGEATRDFGAPGRIGGRTQQPGDVGSV